MLLETVVLEAFLGDIEDRKMRNGTYLFSVFIDLMLSHGCKSHD